MHFLLTIIVWISLPCFIFSQNPLDPVVLNMDFAKRITGQNVPKAPLTDPFQLNRNNSLALDQQYKQIMVGVDAHIAHRASKSRVNSLIEEAMGARSVIYYEKAGRNIPGRDRFFEAYYQIADMLIDSTELSLTKAVYLTEAAYDPSLNWNDFQQSLNKMVTHLGYKLELEKVTQGDQVAKNMALLSFFTDTLTLEYSSKEEAVTSYPMLYDFSDFWGRGNQSKLFISKLMSEGTGQCHSLPLLYLILAEQIDAEAYLAMAPNHSYIKFQDKYGNWHNIELTNQVLTSDQFVQNSGYISAEAIQNKIYMTPLSKKEVVAQCLSDLAIYYKKKFGCESLVREAAMLSLQHNKKSITPHQLLNNYYYHNLRYVMHQYKELNKTQAHFERDEKAQFLKNQLIGSQKYLERIGYRDMPAKQYASWLSSVQEEQNKQSHQTKMRSLTGQIDN